jgi:hypothetical protein
MVRLALLVKLALALRVLHWLAGELAMRLARPVEAPPDGPLPGRMPDPLG